MTNTSTVTIRALRPICIAGQRIEFDGLATVDAADAPELLASGRARLQDEGQRALVDTALQDRNRRLCAQAQASLRRRGSF